MATQTKPAIPTLPGRLTPDGFAVQCDYCRCWHVHGGEPGHRVAHCPRRESPYWERGYTVEIIEPRRRRRA